MSSSPSTTLPIVRGAWRLLKESIDVLLEVTPTHIAPREVRAALRGVWALELVGSAEARKALEAFAKGEAGLTLTDESAASLRRLAKPVGPRP